MPEIMDVFAGSPFRALTLTQVINETPFTPQYLGGTGLYSYEGVRTIDVAVQSRNGSIEVIQTTERGAPAEQATHDKRKMRKAPCSHIKIEDQIGADEIQNALNDAANTSVPQLQTAQELIQERGEGPVGLRARIELTHEYHRMGGIDGVVLDKDGSVLYDWFEFFGMVRPDPVVTNFGALTPEKGDFEVQCTQLVRAMTDELDGLPVMTMNPVALCGDNYYDQIYSNKEVKAARKNADTGRESDVFTSSKAYKSFTYGGITWVNYRGTKDGKVGIPTNEGRLFAAGVPGLFQMLFGPPDIMGLTNTKGAPVFMFMPPERQTSRMAVIEAQSNPLTFCARPLHLRRLTKT